MIGLSGYPAFSVGTECRKGKQLATFADDKEALALVGTVKTVFGIIAGGPNIDHSFICRGSLDRVWTSQGGSCQHQKVSSVDIFVHRMLFWMALSSKVEHQTGDRSPVLITPGEVIHRKNKANPQTRLDPMNGFQVGAKSDVAN